MILIIISVAEANSKKNGDLILWCERYLFFNFKARL